MGKFMGQVFIVFFWYDFLDHSGPAVSPTAQFTSRSVMSLRGVGVGLLSKVERTENTTYLMSHSS